MSKNQAASTVNWRKILKKYLADSTAAAVSRGGVDPGTVALPLLRAAVSGNSPLIAALPELNLVDRVVAEIEALNRELEIDLKMLVIPESGRGKLLFPGGESRRARALNSALNGRFDLVIGSIHALLAPAPPPEETRDAQLVLVPGMEIPIGELVEKLVRLDYDDEYEVSVAGEFARRGGIVDIFSPAHDAPCRIEFFGDEIDSMRTFSPESQRSTGSVSEYRVIGRAGITAGGAADADLFCYFAHRNWRLLTVYPESCLDRLEKYASPEVCRRWETLWEEKEAAQEAMAFYDAASEAYHPEAEAADVFPAAGEIAGEIGESAKAGAEELRRQMLLGNLRRAADSGMRVVALAPHPENLPALEAWCTRNELAVCHPSFDVAGIGAGFSLPAEQLLLITEKELITA